MTNPSEPNISSRSLRQKWQKRRTRIETVENKCQKIRGHLEKKLEKVLGKKIWQHKQYVSLETVKKIEEKKKKKQKRNAEAKKQMNDRQKVIRR